jgi:hypothetical protein
MVRSAFGIRISFFYLYIVLLTASSLSAQVCPDNVTINALDPQLNCSGPCPNLTSVLTGGTGPFTYHTAMKPLLQT